MLAFSNDAGRRTQLLRFASWLEGGSGLTTAVRILEGEGVKMLKLREEAEAELRKDITGNGFKAFPLVVVAPNLNAAVYSLVQSYGVAYENVSQEKTPPHEQKNHFFLLTVSAPGTGNIIA
jgi:hypothetical protein